MRVFSKYSPREVPKILLYDDMKQILVTEWLDRYLPLSHSFGFTPPPPPLPSSSLGLNRGLSDRNMRVSPNLEVDCDTCRAMGTIMGRSHARTHR